MVDLFRYNIKNDPSAAIDFENNIYPKLPEYIKTQIKKYNSLISNKNVEKIIKHCKEKYQRFIKTMKKIKSLK